MGVFAALQSTYDTRTDADWQDEVFAASYFSMRARPLRKADWGTNPYEHAFSYGADLCAFAK